MNESLSWLAAALTAAIVVAYECFLAWLERRHPDQLARTVHAVLREAWFSSISKQAGSEILAVQTLRNSVMSATMIASTAALGLMGTVTLAAPSFSSLFSVADLFATLSLRLALELVLMGLLFSSLVSSIMAVRYYNHAGYVIAMPVGSAARENWAEAGVACLRRAGLLYSWSLRYLMFVMPFVASLLHPLAGPPAAMVLVGVLRSFDRFSEQMNQWGGGRSTG
jgi:hypothetical protein